MTDDLSIAARLPFPSRLVAMAQAGDDGTLSEERIPDTAYEQPMAPEFPPHFIGSSLRTLQQSQSVIEPEDATGLPISDQLQASHNLNLLVDLVYRADYEDIKRIQRQAEHTIYLCKIAERVRVDERECWIWQGKRSGNGRPRATWRGRVEIGARIVLEIKLGRPIKPLFMACHTCDVDLCLNPDHLYEGTGKQNSRDMIDRSRWSPPRLSGEQHGMAKLDWEKVREIRRSFLAGESNKKDLAIRFGVSDVTISNIILNKNWKETDLYDRC